MRKNILKNIFWLKIYILGIILISAGFIGLKIFAQAETKNYCTKIEDITLSTARVIDCIEGYHIEGDTCVSNISNQGLKWEGNIFNGYYIQIADEDEDGIDDSVDNCKRIANPFQEDVDNDGIGDLCDDCFNYRGRCVELEVTQGNFSTIIRPYVTNKSSSEFYCYDGNCANPLTKYGSSSNIVEYSIVYPNRSNIFAYLEVNKVIDNSILSLGFIHDVPGIIAIGDDPIYIDGQTDKDGGIVQFNFSGNGWDMGVISVFDDTSNEFRKNSTPYGNWAWSSCCTDGGMLEIASLDTPWSITIEPILFQGITQWFLKTPGLDGVYSGETLPSLKMPITISYSPPAQP